MYNNSLYGVRHISRGSRLVFRILVLGVVAVSWLFLSWPVAAAPAVPRPAQVNESRVWLGSQHTRLVFDLSTTVSHKLFALSRPERLVLELQNARLASPLRSHDFAGSLIKGMRSSDAGSKGLHIVLDLTRPVLPKAKVVRQGQDRGYQLVLDLYDRRSSRSAEPKVRPAKARMAGDPFKRPADAPVRTKAKPSRPVPAASKPPVLASARPKPTLIRQSAEPQARAATPAAIKRPSALPVDTPVRIKAKPSRPEPTLMRLSGEPQDGEPQAGAATPSARGSPDSGSSSLGPRGPLPGSGSSQPRADSPPLKPRASGVLSPEPVIPGSRASLTQGAPSIPGAKAGGVTVRRYASDKASNPPSDSYRRPSQAPVSKAPISKALETRVSVSTSAKRARDIVVVIDAGHGGQDPGAIGPRGVREKDVTLAIARKLAALVERQPSMRAVLTRYGDVYLPLRERTRIARERKADLFVSIHADAFTDMAASGSSIFVLSEHGASSEAARWLAERENAADLIGGVRLVDKDDVVAAVLLDLSQTAVIEESMGVASQVLGALRRVGNIHKQQVQFAGFAVLKSPDVPSILVETAFITNPLEERKLSRPAYQDEVARALLEGIRAYFAKRLPAPNVLAGRETI